MENERTRAYRRYQRNRSILRKKNICRKVWNGSFYPHDGMYSKGKIHCSCWMCSGKGLLGEHLWTKGEILAYEDMENGLKAYERGILDTWDAIDEESEKSA